MRKADNLPPSCALVTKSGNLNFLEPSGPVQACNGTALHFLLPFYKNSERKLYLQVTMFGLRSYCYGACLGVP